MLCSRLNRRTQPQPATCNRTVAAPPEIAALLLPGERLVTGPVAAHGWRYESAEVAYDRKTLMVGGPLLFVLTGTVSALRNRRLRRAAEAQAAPQWRPLGPLTVLATTDRLLVWHQNAWWSVWYLAIEHATLHDEQLHLRFHDGAAPYLLAGGTAAVAAAISANRQCVDV